MRLKCESPKSRRAGVNAGAAGGAVSTEETRAGKRRRGRRRWQQLGKEGSAERREWRRWYERAAHRQKTWNDSQGKGRGETRSCGEESVWKVTEDGSEE